MGSFVIGATLSADGNLVNSMNHGRQRESLSNYHRNDRRQRNSIKKKLITEKKGKERRERKGKEAKTMQWPYCALSWEGGGAEGGGASAPAT